MSVLSVFCASSSGAATQISASWTSGGGADYKTSTAANWSTAIDFSQALIDATFPSGDLAVVDNEIVFKSLTFTVHKFEFRNGGGKMKLTSNSVSFSANTDGAAREFIFGAPLELAGSVSLSLSANTSLRLKGGITADGTPGTITVNMTGTGQKLVLDGVNMAQNLAPNSPAGAIKVELGAGSINRIGGTFKPNDTSGPTFAIPSGASLEVAGGTRFVNGVSLTGGGTFIFSGKPLMSRYDKTFAVRSDTIRDGGLTLVFSATGNCVPLTIASDAKGGTIDCRVNEAFASDPSFISSESSNFRASTLTIGTYWQGYSALKLNNTSQSFVKVMLTRAASTGDLVISGEHGARLRTTGAEISRVQGARDFPLTVNGELTLENAGTGRLVISDIEYNGTLILKLTGTGGLLLPDGVEQKVTELWVGEAKLPVGRYTYANAPEALKPLLGQSTGVIKVGRVGFVAIGR